MSLDPSHWSAYARWCQESFQECSFQEELIRECGGHADIAWAVHYHCRERSLDWLRATVPALDDARACDLIASGQADQVRECLMRFP
ncbi:hypothetical protein [Lysobacter sp. CA199]|uniref:hypothetical protein n=1 Tax=Lysobacter sp. CA199 TaxID=3455608 RepID=UPI003F8D6781